MEWQWSAFEQLSVDDLYAVLAARQEVFILEQRCFYPDIDGIDRGAHHLIGWSHHDGERKPAAYLRCVPPGVKFDEPSLGRVLTAPFARGSGAGKVMMEEALRRAEQLHSGRAIRISAQLYLQRFYEGFGFRVTSAPYDEDGIPHIEMLREAAA
jgi:ElaA protein